MVRPTYQRTQNTPDGSTTPARVDPLNVTTSPISSDTSFYFGEPNSQPGTPAPSSPAQQPTQAPSTPAQQPIPDLVPPIQQSPPSHFPTASQPIQDNNSGPVFDPHVDHVLGVVIKMSSHEII